MANKIKIIYKYIIEILTDLFLIFCQSKSLYNKFLIFSDYLKLNILFLVSKLAIKKNYNPKKITILGFKIQYFNYGELRLLFREIFIHETYKFLSDKRDPFIIDCGANIGISIIYFKILYPEASIIAFEANKDAFDLLDYNIKSNNIKNIKIVNAAVMNRSGSLNFYVDNNPQKNSVYNSINKWVADEGINLKEITVPCVKLSTYIDEKSVDLLKMDIEGSEYDVMEDMEMSLKKVNNIILEYHCSVKDEVWNPNKLLNIITRQRFEYLIISFIELPLYNKTCKNWGGIIYAFKKTI